MTATLHRPAQAGDRVAAIDTPALVLDLASPWLVARHTAAVPPHPEHLPERFGLFTIILLGEGLAAVVHALDHGKRWSGKAGGHLGPSA